MIEKEIYFTLENFNVCLENLELGYMECKSRPTPISMRTLKSTGNSLKQSGMCYKYRFTFVYSVHF